MKKMLGLLVLLVAAFAQAATVTTPAPTLSLVEARKGIGEAVTDPGKVRATMKQLSPADQVAYVAALNAAIAKLPGSESERTATYLNVNAAAVMGASKGNLKAVVAEVFATASVESLPVIHSEFATKFFNRAASATVTYTDAQFVKISGEVMKSVNERVGAVDNGDARSGFAALMFLRASNTPTAPDMVDAIVQMMPKEAQEKTKGEWFPAATSSEPDYTDMLAGSSYEGVVDNNIMITIPGPVNHAALFGDLTTTYDSVVAGTITDAIFNPVQNAQAPMGDAGKEGITPDIKKGEYIDEPRGYQWQII